MPEIDARQLPRSNRATLFFLALDFLWPGIGLFIATLTGESR